MDRREKLEFLLEQMRLCLAKDDYIRTQIISKKINIKSFEDEASHVIFYFYQA
jgi:26S proteasome regulatory subunit N5